jgi:alkylhydroperoxidase domain protein
MSTLTPITQVSPPPRFTQETLGWVPWVEPLDELDLTERHYEGLVQRPKAKNPYFRLLARDPEVLGARTKTDLDIFYNTADGLGRAERELGAAVASRSNGCVYCASVHSAFATHFSKRGEEVQRLLDDGVGADLGDEAWNAVRDAVVALTATPVRFGAEHVAALRASGLDDVAVLDVINSGAFFNWANRLMLSLGEPTLS